MTEYEIADLKLKAELVAAVQRLTNVLINSRPGYIDESPERKVAYMLNVTTGNYPVGEMVLLANGIDLDTEEDAQVV